MSKNAMDFMNEFFPGKLTSGAIIRAKRKNFGITLDEVAGVTGISITNLSAIENDKKNIGLKTATKIGLAVGLHPTTILFPNGFNEIPEEFKEMEEKGRALIQKKMSAA